MSVVRLAGDRYDESEAALLHPEPERPSADAPPRRCSHFSVSSATVDIPGLHRLMQVPVYRCALAEVMVARLKTVPAGLRLAESMEASPLDDKPRLICGPDLEAISTTTCVPDRCRRSCVPGFIQLLGDLGLDAAVVSD